ncbi:MAG: hypothetical protein ACXABI_14995 [Candidatus Hodarchaeales archaeon]
MNDIAVKRGLWNVSYLILILISMSMGMVTSTRAVETIEVNLKVEWETYFGGSMGDSLLACIRTQDGGFVALVTTKPNYATLVKFTANGQQEWNTTFWYIDGSQWLSHWPVASLIQTTDEGYVIIDHTDEYQRIHKRSSTGYHEWNSTFSGEEDFAHTIIQSKDGGFILTGATADFSPYNYNFWLVKTDNQGLPEWNRTFRHTLAHDVASTVIQTSDGGYAIAGSSSLGLLKTNANGTEEWHTGRQVSGDIHRIIQLPDDSYILGGNSKTEPYGFGDFVLYKTTSIGELMWDHHYGRGVLQSLIQTADGGYLLAGDSYYWWPNLVNIWLVKTNAAGQQEWNTTLGGSVNYTTRGSWVTSVFQMPDESFIIAGTTHPPGKNDTDMWLFKMSVTEVPATKKTGPDFESSLIILSITLFIIAQKKKRRG